MLKPDALRHATNGETGVGGERNREIETTEEANKGDKQAII